MKSLYLGIDPGKMGGVATLNSGGTLVSCMKTPVIGKEYDLQEMVAYVKNPLVLSSPPPEVKAVIEKVGAFPGQGVTAMFNFGMGWGFWQGIMAALGTPFEMVQPRQWQMIVSMPHKLSKPERKKVVIAWARRLWPDIPNHSGVCEAAAMAEWLRRRETGNG